MANPDLPRRVIDWQSIRDFYIKTPQRPTFDEMADKFAVARSSISNASSDEGWPIIRANYLDAQIQASGAREIILSALSCAKAIVDAGTNFGLVMLQELTAVVQDGALATRAASTRADVLNTCSFAAANTARAMKDLGVVGFAKALSDEGKGGNGQWNPQMLQQINLTVQNLTAQAAAKPGDPPAGAAPMPAVVSPVPPAPSGGVSSDVPVEPSVSCPRTR